jgi:phage shock protein A
MGIIRDIYDKGEKTLNDIKKKYQNPLREFEKELNNLKLLLKESKSVAAHINALRIRADKDILEYKIQAGKYLQKAENAIADLNSATIPNDVAEQVSLSSLKMKKAYENRIDELTTKIPIYDKELEQVKEKMDDLKTKIVYYEKEYHTLKNNKLRSEENEIFYDDISIIARLEKLKENIILLTTTEKSTASNSSDMTRNIDNESVQKEFEELKNKAKK